MTFASRAMLAAPDSAGTGRRLALAFALYGLLSGLLSLAGWAFDLRRLTDWDNDGISIQPNAGLAAAAVGAALVLVMHGRRGPASILAAFATALGVLTAVENLSGVDFGIDHLLLFGHDWGAVATTAPGRMGLPASLSWGLLGTCLLLRNTSAAAGYRSWAPWLALLPLGLSTLSILGYVYESSQLYAVPGLTAIALQTATFVFALSIAMIASAESGPMKLFGDPGPAGIAARLLLPIIFAVPVVTGYFRLAGERAGLYDTAFGVALHNMIEITLLLSLVWLTGRALMRHFELRRLAELERQELLVSEQAARQEAERQATIRDEFLATLSHELRTPLNAILGWTQILKIKGADADRVGQAVEVIERNARLQAQLIDDLLDMSRILAGKLKLQVQPLDLVAVASAAIDAVRPAADARDIQIEPALEPVGNVVNGDAGRLQQAIWNLLTNAVKFTPRGGRVQVLVTRADSHVEIRVSDSGEGIDHEFLPKIFERFRQADASEARRHGGLGLGLALVKQIVELHGGRISATSEGAGRGATFSITLPLAILQPQAPEQPARRRAAAAAPAGEGYADLEGVRLLVVDDDADSLEMVASLLEARGASVVTTSNATDAVAIASTQRFDTIVSDIGMPGRDGYDLIRDLREHGVSAPAIALTAYARNDDRTRALSSGYQSHLAKPVEADELLATIAALSRP